MKLLTVFLLLLGIYSCENNKSQHTQNQVLASSKIDSLTPDEVEFSEINWNYYLKKNNFEQGADDSALLVVIKPNFALFVSAQEDMTTSELIAYDVTGFQKQNNRWVKTIREQVAIEEIHDYHQKKWRLEDINGDGYNDVLLKIYDDGKQNKKFVCFLQKPEQKTFLKTDKY